MDIKLHVNNDFYKEEVRNDYTVSSDMKRVWAVELDLLTELQRVCEKHKLIYYACCGTLLGAIRHDGFIPWDDDVDLMMPRTDYEKLCEIANEEFQYPYFFQNDDTDYGFSRDFARLRNSSTTGIQKYELNAKVPYNQGIFIDIFPLDNVPDDEEERMQFLNNIKRIRDLSVRLFRLSVSYSMIDDNQGGRIKLGTRHILGRLLKKLYVKNKIKNPFLIRYRKIERRYNDVDTKKWGLLWFYGTRQRADWIIWDKEDFRNVDIKDFEFVNINVPSGFEKILTHTYGNWKVFVKGNNVHGDMLFDTEKPYVEYL